MDMDTVSEFHPRLYIGDSDAANNIRLLNRHGITGVLTCGIMYSSWCECMASRYEPHKDSVPGHSSGQVLHHCLELFDSLQADIKPHVDSAMRFVHHCLEMNDNARVLIHCHAGQSRCASFCVAFLMTHTGMGPGPCLSALRTKYPKASPNRAFLKQLHDLDAAQWPNEFSRDVLLLHKGVAQRRVIDNGADGSTAMVVDTTGDDDIGKGRIKPLVVIKDQTVLVHGASSSPPASGVTTPTSYLSDLTDAVKHDGTATAAAYGNEYFDLVAAVTLETSPKDINKCPGTSTAPASTYSAGDDDFDGFFATAFRYEGSLMDRRNKAVKEARAAAVRRKAQSGSSTPTGTSSGPTTPTTTSVTSGADSTCRQAEAAVSSATKDTAAAAVSSTNSSTQPSAEDFVRCRVCLTRLCSDSDLLSHVPTAKQKNQLFYGKQIPQNECSSYFVQRMPWMRIDDDEQRGKLICPNDRCGWKLGGYCLFGERCSCGHWQVPSYRIQLSRVDRYIAAEGYNRQPRPQDNNAVLQNSDTIAAEVSRDLSENVVHSPCANTGTGTSCVQQSSTTAMTTVAYPRCSIS